MFGKDFFRPAPPEEVSALTEEDESDIPSELEKREISPELVATLEAHVVDIDPAQFGRTELVRKLGDAAIGAADALITRPDPPITVESLALAPGKIKVLIGPNGAGKSTLFDTLMERGAHFDIQNGRGAAVYGNPAHVREKLRIARLDQEELLGQIGALSARRVLEGAAAHFKDQFPVDWENSDRYDENMKNQEARIRIESLISQITKLFQIEEFLERDVQALSGGERTKLALFLVMASEPDVMLLDEPTNHLDLRSIAKLMALFSQYKNAGVATVNVSHVDWFLRDAGMDGVIEIAWDEKRRRVRDSNAPYHAYVKDASRGRVPLIEGDVEWPSDYGYKRGSAVIEASQKFSIKDSPLRGVTFPTINGGDTVVLSGDNGTGKTRLIETLVHNWREDLPRKRKGVQIAHLPQFWPEEVARGTVGDFFFWIKGTASPHSNGSAYHKDQPPQNLFVDRARELHFGGSKKIGEGWLNRPLARLSGGEQRLLWFLAVSSLRDVDMLALDEPTNHMDRNLQQKITRAIQTFPGAVILSTHDRALLETLSSDAGTINGILRIPRHLVLEKARGVTEIHETNETPGAYMKRIMEDARREARQVKI